jgi:hypothetical protein
MATAPKVTATTAAAIKMSAALLNSGLAVNNEKVFLTVNHDLWVYNATTGDLLDTQQFHTLLDQYSGSYVSPPVPLGNETFIIGDHWLYAYT